MSLRDVVAQHGPDGSLPWENFPRHAVRPDRVIFYRAVRKDRGAWWFCSCGDCRFDLPAPRGTCYVGTDPVCGVMESIGFQLCSSKLPLSTPDFLQQWTVHSVRPVRTFQVANLVTRGALAFGVTNELSSMTPYAIPQMFAALFDTMLDGRREHRFHGIRYRTRFDTGGTPRGLALFDDGEARQWKTLDRQPIDRNLLLRISAHLTVAPPPSIDELDVTDYDVMGDAKRREG